MISLSLFGAFGGSAFYTSNPLLFISLICRDIHV